jgi:HD-GYP domain-containing protein (c-di-GMP phosphodiesterase class II)
MALQIRLAEILGSLSRALDLTEGQPPGHCVRCCWIGVAIGRELGLSERELRDLYYALLLKDLGCSSNAARICELYLADDLTFKKDFKLLDGSLPQVLRFVLSHTGAHAGLAERFRSIVNILQNGGQIAHELIETRCQRGADIARQMRFSDAVAGGILDLDEHWDGGGKPLGRAGAEISLFARIALLAQVVDVFHAGSGRAAALTEAGQRTGSWFDPAVVRAFREVAKDESFWERLGCENLEDHVLAMEPGQEMALADEDYLDDIAQAFARVIDAKSPFTSGHSERVAVFSDMIAEELGFDDERRRWLKRAALLHDIGKLGVSNSVLDKNGKLDDAEWLAMKGHAGLSEAILSRISAFADLSRVAGAHHERLDGKGYPRGLAGDEIDLETRVVSTADVFDALTADRPYRAAMPVSKALAILREGIGASHDAICVAALERSLQKASFAKAA